MDKRTPVILIGAGRSGTKFLRSCLSASEEVVSVPYDIGYVWRFGNENIEHDELAVNDVTKKIKSYITNTLPTLTNAGNNDARFIVEKSVPNTLRVSFINEIYPNAKFVYLFRDGRAVIESAVRQWNKPVSRSYLVKKIRYFPWKNYRYAFWYLCNLIGSKISKKPYIWGPRYEGIMEDLVLLTVEEVCAKQWSRCVDLADEQLDKIDESRVFRMSFEELMNDSQKLIELCEFIGINDTGKVESFFIKNVERENNQKSMANLNAKTIAAINKYAKVSLQRLGYMK